MNIKFPKEVTRKIEEIKEVIYEKQYSKVLNYYDEIIENAKSINNINQTLITEYIDILFEMRMFEKIISFVEELRKIELENFNWYYYVFVSLIYRKDFYYAKSIILRSKILQEDSIKYLIDENEINLNSVFNLHDSLFKSVAPCLIIINFINELIVEALNKKIDEEYIIMRFFDLLNLLYEYGIDEEIIGLFSKTVETIYEIKIV